jgi:hypothetical protein
VGGQPLSFISVLLLKIRVLMDFTGPIGARELAVLVIASTRSSWVAIISARTLPAAQDAVNGSRGE